MNRTLYALTALVILCAPGGASAHEDDFEVGIDPNLNQILIEYDVDLFPWDLPPSEWGPNVAGFALDDPGFVSLEDEHSEPGVFEPLSPGANIALRVLSVSSPEMKVWDPVGPGEPGFQIFGDNLWIVGAPLFDVHPVWHIDTQDPAYDPAHAPWTVTFEVLDLSGTHATSDPVSVQFTPEPTVLVGLVLGSALLRRVRGESA